VNLRAAGIHIGAASHFVAAPEGRDADGRAVRECATFTADLYALVSGLTACGIETVAMESTGMYWIPLFDVLSARGFDVKLVDPGCGTIFICPHNSFW
jgi:transposase